MTLVTELTEAINKLIESREKNVYHSAIGYFQSYSTVESDEVGNRFCDLKLHYKTGNSEDINILEVPILYPGSQNSIDDWSLVSGDELEVFFTNRSLEQWKDSDEPQKLSNGVLSSVNHAFCIPVNTHRNNFALAPDSTVSRRITVKSGKKMQFGNGTDEFLKIHYDFMSIINGLVTTDGDALAADLATKKTQINALVVQMANITKI